MSRKEHRDSTTDFFLKVISREKEQEKTNTINTNINEGIDNKSEKLINGIVSISNFINSTLDKMLQSNLSVKILSFILSMILLFSVNGGSIENLLSTPNSGDYVKNVPVLVENLQDEYVVSGLPETVSVGLVGPSLDIYNTKLSKEYQIFADLSGLGEGEHTIELKYRNFPQGLNVLVNPQTINITITKKVTKTFDLSYQFINKDSLGKDVSVSVDSIEHSEVEVRGSQDNIDKIHTVQAIVDLQDVEKSFTQECKIKAFDRSGKEIPVEVIPSKVKVKCSVSNYSKKVPLVPQYIGNVQNGFVIESVNFKKIEVKVYGDEEKLKDVKDVSVKIDVSSLNSDTEFQKLELIKPTNVNELEFETVDATVHITESVSRQFANVPIQIRNKGVKDIILNRGEIKLTVMGPSQKVNALDPSRVVAYIDADSLRKGTQSVNVLVELSDKTLTYTIDSNKTVNATLK